jgi:tagatose 6-phosphate kinase
VFLTVCLNPTIQSTLVLTALTENRIIRTQEHFLDISGKGVNVSRVLVRLGARVVHLTHSGGHWRRFLSESARREKIHLRTVQGRMEIRYCHTLLSRDTGSCTEIVEDGTRVSRAVEKKMRTAYKRLLARCQAVIISGSKTEGYSDSIFPDMVALAKKKNKQVILDVRGLDLLNCLHFKPDIIKPNLTEFVQTFLPDEEGGRQKTITRLVEEKMIELERLYKIKTILTDGPRPVRYVLGGRVFQSAVEPVATVNTTGCGDAFCAGLARSWLLHRNFERAIGVAVQCGRRNALSVRPGFLSD